MKTKLEILFDMKNSLLWVELTKWFKWAWNKMLIDRVVLYFDEEIKKQKKIDEYARNRFKKYADKNREYVREQNRKSYHKKNANP